MMPLVDDNMLMSAVAASVCTSFENVLETRQTLQPEGNDDATPYRPLMCMSSLLQPICCCIALLAESDVQMWPIVCFTVLKSVGELLRPRQVYTREPNITDWWTHIISETTRSRCVLSHASWQPFVSATTHTQLRRCSYLQPNKHVVKTFSTTMSRKGFLLLVTCSNSGLRAWWSKATHSSCETQFVTFDTFFFLLILTDVSTSSFTTLLLYLALQSEHCIFSTSSQKTSFSTLMFLNRTAFAKKKKHTCTSTQ